MTAMFRLLIALLIAWPLAGAAAEDFLEPEKAFRFSTRTLDDRTLEVGFDIAPGYYMYREQFRFEAAGATLGPVEIPRGKVKFDENFGKNVETYRGALRIRVPVAEAPPSFSLAVTSQGCADAGLCYPPMTSTVDDRPGRVRRPGRRAGRRRHRDGPGRLAGAEWPAPAGDEGAIAGALQSGRFWSVVAVFFGAGLLLSLTPCVLPMLPILSSIIVGHGGTPTRARGLALAASYSLGMALVYTAFGVAAGLAGEGLAAALQTPWILGAFALLLVAFSLSMFGVYELRLPHAVSGGLARGLLRLRGGRFAAVFVMGGVSALIVSPCVAAPLAGALVYLEPDARCHAGRHGAVRARRRHEHAADAAGRLGGCAAAARGRVDGRRQALLRRAAAGRRALDGAAAAAVIAGHGRVGSCWRCSPPCCCCRARRRAAGHGCAGPSGSAAGGDCPHAVRGRRIGRL